MTQKAAVVKVNSDGEVLECAKGLDAAECGYKAGAPVCGKCGAIATQVKAMADAAVNAPKKATGGEAIDDDLNDELDEKAMTDDEDVIDSQDAEEMYTDQEAPKKKKGKIQSIALTQGMEGEQLDESQMADEENDATNDTDADMGRGGDVPSGAHTGDVQGNKKKRNVPMEESDEETADMANEEEKSTGTWGAITDRRNKIRARGMKSDDMSELDEEDDMSDMEDDSEEKSTGTWATIQENRAKMRKRRMQSMGFKSADFDDEAYVCAFDRKVYPGGAGVCDSCPGGCVSEKGMPALIEIEGMAEDMFRGKVLDSGYSDEADLFVVDVERKDGKPVEIFFDGSTGEVMGWHVLSNDVIEVKSALQEKVLVSFGEAADIAVKSVEGDIVAVEPDVFEGFDVYAVEIEGINGKSYDVFVSLDGEVLGYDEYTQEEASAIEAEAAEIALKRAYSEESRMHLAKLGHALADGSFPIKDEADLRNAIQAFGRAKNPAEAKAHIMKRAVDLGLEDLIPKNWTSSEKTVDTQDVAEKSQESEFLSNLMEFEMLSVEEELNQLDSE